ncbi:unnamed protein product [Calypogeia fissa]
MEISLKLYLLQQPQRKAAAADGLNSPRIFWGSHTLANNMDFEMEASSSTCIWVQDARPSPNCGACLPCPPF